MLEVEGAPEAWCAALGATDGALELRVGEPPGGPLRRRGREAWLRDRGFHHVPDAWSLPVAAGTDSEECAATLAVALDEALHADLSAPLRRVLAHPGCARGELPPPDAPPAEHVAAALRALAMEGRGRVDLSGGRPARPWAIVWAFADDRELQIEPESELGDDQVWREPLSLDGAAAATRALGARTEGLEGPLFLAYLAP
jgi:hypothetical protein